MGQAVLRIQVDTLSDVPDGQGRIDGVPNKVVTIRSVGPGSQHELNFWDVSNPGINGATSTSPDLPTLTPLGDNRSWQFTPNGGANGYGQSFGLELVVDRGQYDPITRKSIQSVSRRIYAIPTASGLVLPVFAEGCDPQASLQNNGAAQVGVSADNANGNWRGYHPRLLDWLMTQAKYAGRIEISPTPFAGADTPDPTVPTLVHTCILEAGTLVKIGADIGDLTSSFGATLQVKLQGGPATVLATMTVGAQAKQWTEQVFNTPIPARAAYEFYMHSATGGSWLNKGINVQAR